MAMFKVRVWANGNCIEVVGVATLDIASEYAREQSIITGFAEIENADGVVCWAYECGQGLTYIDDEQDDELYPEDFDDTVDEVGYNPYTGGYDCDL